MENIINKDLTSDIRYISREDESFPAKLLELHDCPKGIYVRGQLPDQKKKTVAIVGARMCSPYGRATAMHFAKVLAENDVQIISGLALGVDGAAHEGALLANGKTYAVLAGGVDRCYPRSHIGLYENIRMTGGILSEEACGCPPIARLFPKRNRLISILSDMILVIEAKEKSGSLITADYAAEQGRDIFAIPGRIGDELSKGCNELIFQGAGVAISPERMLEIMGKCVEKSDNSKSFMQNALARRENIVYSCLSLQPKSLEVLCKETKLPLMEITESIMLLQLQGVVKEIGRNRYIKSV